MKPRIFSCLFLSLASLGAQEVVSPAGQALKTLQAVGPEGKGNEEAAAAWKLLAQEPANEIPTILGGMAGANAVAKNYLYAAAKAIASRPNVQLPHAAMESFVLNAAQDATARKVCYDLLMERDVSAKERLLPKLQKDPCGPLRREAAQRYIDIAKAAAAGGKKEDAAAAYQQALGAALDEDQVTLVADELKALGKPPSLLDHFGFVKEWSVIGPFHNKDRAGYAEKFPVEPPARVDLAAPQRGVDGPLAWKKITVQDPMGLVLFNKELGEKKEVTAYAVTDFVVKEGRQAQLRLGSKNAWKIWLNGVLVFERDEYHRGRRIDQYILPVELRAGSNQILVKCCQNEEKQTWTGEWQFQLRITDLSGDALKSEK